MPPVNTEDFQFEHYMYIHNVFGHFFKNTLDYFSDYLYPRFQYKVIGTYDKAVEYLNKNEQYDREIDKPNLPAIILNPSGEFLPSDRGGKQFWRFPNLQGGFGYYLFDPIYKDMNVSITPVFSRLKGEMEIIVLPSSFYEYCDLRLFFLQIFGGVDRPIYPLKITSNIILPDNFFGYKYENKVENFEYTLDWDNSASNENLIRTLNRNLHIFPCIITPWLTLTGMSDGSERYGGTDKLAEWRLVLNIDYDIELPTFLILSTDMMLKKININFFVGTSYASNDVKPETNIFSEELNIQHMNLDETSTRNLFIEDAAENSEEIEEESYSINEYILRGRYYYVITELDKTSTEDITIILEKEIENQNKLNIICKEGGLYRGTQFDILSDMRTIIIYREHIYEDIQIGDIYEIFEYEKK